MKSKNPNPPPQKSGEKKQAQYIRLSAALFLAALSLAAGIGMGYIFSGVAAPVQTTIREFNENTSDAQPPSPSLTEPEPSNISPEIAGRIQQLTETLKTNGANAEDWKELGNLFFDTHQFSNAITAYRNYLKRDPNNPGVWTDMGIMLRSSGQPEEALKAFEKAIAIDPAHQPSRFNKGVVLMHDLNRRQEALQAWRELIAINPNARASDGRSIRELVAAYPPEPGR